MLFNSIKNRLHNGFAGGFLMKVEKVRENDYL